MNLGVGTPIGKYVVRSKLAEGGMAEIYLCTSTGPEGFQKEVVIKRVRPHLATDPGFIQMFISEAKVASRLSHPNLVQIFDFDKHEDTYYLAMEYVRGPSLWTVRRRSREMMLAMPPTLVAHLGAEIARGLHYAHRVTENGSPLGLVHRDVSPQNILLSFDGAIKLTDFGIAKAGDGATAPGVLKGKFAYMSPEQARGEVVDARTDIFALGIVLWEMLTGGRLFEGDSDLALLRAVQQSVIAPPARLNPDVPPELDAVIMRALNRDVAARFQTAQELERGLMEAVLLHKRRLEDTDLVGYLKVLFPEEASVRIVKALDPAAPPALPSVPTAAAGAPRQLPADSQPSSVVDQASPALAADELPYSPTDVIRGNRPVIPAAPSPRSLGRRGRAAIAAVLLVAVAALVVATLQDGGSSRRSQGGGAPVQETNAPVLAAAGRVPASSVVAAPAEAPHTESPVNDAAAGPDPSRRSEYGVLELTVKPWANVFIDDRKPIELSQETRELRLPVGMHHVRFKHLGRSEEHEVSISKGKKTRLSFSVPEAGHGRR